MCSEPHEHLSPPPCCRPVSRCSRLFSLQHPLPAQGGLPDLDIYLYNKPGGQGTGGKGKLQGLGLWHSLYQMQERLLFTSRLESLVAEEGPGEGCVQMLSLSLPMAFYTGVACITLAFVEEGGTPISLASWPPSSPGPPDPLREEEFEQLTQVIRCPNTLDSCSGKTACGAGVFPHCCDGKGGS